MQRSPMKILLVMPHPDARRGFFARFTYPSLTLKQLAAIIPAEHEIRIIDERFEQVDVSDEYDAVGISCLTYNAPRGYELADAFRKQGVTVFFGGIMRRCCLMRSSSMQIVLSSVNQS